MSRSQIRQVGEIFALTFFLNLLWENLQSGLYATYQGGPLTESILLRATLGDAVILTALAVPFIYEPWMRSRIWIIVPLGVAIAILIELFAQSTGRWTYAWSMPLVPYLHIGLVPTIQLGLLGYLACRLVLRRT